MTVSSRLASRSIFALWAKRLHSLRQRSPSRFVVLSRPATWAWCVAQASSERKYGTVFRQNLFSNPPQWWDSDETPRHPDFRHHNSNNSMWLNNRYKPAWVESQSAILDAQLVPGLRRGLPASLQGAYCTLAVHDGDLEVRTCRKLCKDGPITEAVDALNRLVKQTCHIPNNLFYYVLKRCIAQKDLVLGRRIHALTVDSGYDGNAFLATHLIGLYASHGKLDEALRVFSRVTLPSAHNWGSIILAYAKHGEPTQALGLYRQMRESTVKPDNHIFVAILKACASARDLTVGRNVHAHISASRVQPDIFVQTCLVDMYAKCHSLDDAQRVFDKLSKKNVVTWTAMIAGYTQQGMGDEALNLYNSMQREGITPPNSITFGFLLQACVCVGRAALQCGQQLHAQIEELGLLHHPVVGNNLISMYTKCGSVMAARRVFNRLCHRDVVTWTAMIAGYVQQGMGREAFCLYTIMQEEGNTPPNYITFVCLLQACATVAGLPRGKQLHAQIEERGLQADVVVRNSLINMYAKCGSLDDAQRVFDELPQKDVVTWNAIIAGYAQQGLGEKALSLYTTMQEDNVTPPDSVTFVCLLQACSSLGIAALLQGQKLHVQIEEQGLLKDVVVGNSLVNMYTKCGSLDDARRLFDRLPHRDIVTWNVMIAGYAKQGLGQEALVLYNYMQQEGNTPPDSVTFVCLLQACASVGALPLGRELHAQVEAQGLQGNLAVGSSLVNMYAKCGSLEEARQVFDSLPEIEIVAWNALIAGYTRQGDSEVVFDLVDRMRQDGVEPDSITFLSVLTVCSHVGLVDKGSKYFESMNTEFGITPNIDHYTCIMDLLGRAGYLDEALEMLRTMPFDPNGAVWRTLLGACRKWGDVEVGRQAFQFAVRLDEKDTAAYMLMSNIYAGAQMWEEAKQMQTRRLEIGAWKEQGQSWWTDMDGVMHRFVV